MRRTHLSAEVCLQSIAFAGGYNGTIKENAASTTKNHRNRGDPYGIRTRISAVKGPRPNP